MRRCIKAAAAGLALLIGLLVATTPASQAVDARAVGKTFRDGLDTRHSAVALMNATRTLGYTSTAYSEGRSASEAWNDGKEAAVLGLFGHANAGLMRVGEAASEPDDEYITAGVISGEVLDFAYGKVFELIGLSYTVKAWTEYLPFIDVDDVRLAILGGCYTANGDALFGDFEDAGAAVGVDALIAFTDLVYNPSNCGANCVSAGNYFWDRFSAHIATGVSAGVAMSQARTELVAREGNAWGWDKYRITGTVADPAGTVLAPSGAGQPLTSQPLGGVSPFTSVSSLTEKHRSVEQSLLGSVLSVASNEGVNFRRDMQTGRLIDLYAPASTQDVPMLLTPAEAESVALAFLEEEGLTVDAWAMSGDLTNHGDGQALASFAWREVRRDGVPGGRQVSVEVDRKTGALTYFAAVEAPSSAAFSIDPSQAIEAALAVASDPSGRVTSTQDVWARPRYFVQIDHGHINGVPIVEVIEVDGQTGEVLGQRST